jgi:hypothetical protein
MGEQNTHLQIMASLNANIRSHTRGQEKRGEQKIVLSAPHIVELTHENRIVEAEERGANFP